MVTNNRRSLLSMAMAALGLAMVANTLVPARAFGVRPVERVNIEELFEDEVYGPPAPAAREFRCEFLYEAPARPGGAFKICAYDCLGYGAAATFPWPADLPCPGSFDGLFPNIPEGYPAP